MDTYQMNKPREFLMEVASPTLHHVVLAHISQNNNTPTIACKHATQALWKTGFSEDIKIHYTQQRSLCILL